MYDKAKIYQEILLILKLLDLIVDSLEGSKAIGAKRTATEHVALTANLLNRNVSKKDLIKQCSFPLETHIKPCGNLSAINVKMRMGINASSNDPLKYQYVQYPERLTLEKL